MYQKALWAMPEVEIGVAHGQMTREDIEDVMLQFTDNKYQVLVCTTIIETGIDIPNANTILIEDADHFGLSQLYQIKGRVGRSDRLAYAYLMYSAKAIKGDCHEALKIHQGIHAAGAAVIKLPCAI